MLEDIPDGNRQVVVGVHQPNAGGNDAVAVKINVVAEGDVKFIFQRHEIRHRVGAGTIHPDFPILIQGHKRESGVHAFVDNLNVQTVFFRDWLPIPDTRASQRVYADMNTGSCQCFHIHDAVQVVHVGGDQVNLMGCISLERFREPETFHIFQPAADDFVGAVLNPLGGVCIRGAAVRRVVLEAAVIGRVMRGRYNHPIRQAALPAGIIGQDGVGDYRRGRVAHLGVNHDFHVVAGKHLNRAVERRLGKRVRVHPHEEGPINAGLFAVFINRLADGKHVVFIKAAVQRGSAVPAGAKCHCLGRVLRVRVQGVIGGNQARDIDKRFKRGGFSCEWVNGHGFSLSIGNWRKAAFLKALFQVLTLVRVFAILVVFRKLVDFAGIADGSHAVDAVRIGDAQLRAGAFVVKPSHGMHDQTHRGALQGEVFKRHAGVKGVRADFFAF